VALSGRGWAGLSAALGGWARPRARHVAVALEPYRVRPYVQLLNTSAWLLYESDLDPERSHAEFLAYLLVHGDRMAVTGEVTLGGLHTAAYWFGRDEAQRAAFAGAAQRSTRPDAQAFRLLAAAIGWLGELRHDG